MGSGDGIQAGRVTTAESTTDVLGAVPSEQDVDFNGTVILRAAPQPGLLEPTHGLDGIHGVGHSDVILPGGTGVVGFGGLRQGTGMAGVGGGLNGQGGIGVHGHGGSASEPEVDPGAGMVAQGGMINEINVRGRFHGAGVIALSGGADKAIPLLTDTGSVGVYAQGADAEIATVDIQGVPTVVGPSAPGPGVLGRGGVPIPRKEEPVAAGVIGLAGDNPIPLISESGNVGVYGTGPTGVRGIGPRSGVEGLSNFMGVSGQGVHGPGVNGVGHPGVVGSAVDDSSRGGEFVSKRAAQVRLIPQRLQQRIPNQVTVTPTAIPVASAPALPRSGLAGDLMVVEMETEDKQHVSRLWLCVQSGTTTRRARWSEVLIGASFDGQA